MSEQRPPIPRVAMVVRNPVSRDARVLRAAGALAAAGYDVTIVGVQAAGLAPIEHRDGFTIVRIASEGRMLRAFASLARSSAMWGARTSAPYRRSVFAARRVRERIFRQWRLLGAEASVSGVVRAHRVALRAPGSALVASALLPLALVRMICVRTAVEQSRPDRPTPRSPFIAPLDALASGIARLILRPRRLVSAWTFQRMAGRTMATLKPAAYHCHDLNTLAAGRLAARLHPAPVVYDSHELYLHRSLAEFPRLKRLVFGVAERWMIRRAAAVVTVNESIGVWLARRYGIEPPVVVMNVPVPGTGPDDASVPEAFSWPGPRVLYLGNITAGRGLEEAIRSLCYIPDALLIVMGPVARPEYLEEILNLADERGVGERVAILPPVPPEAVDSAIGAASVGLSVLRNLSLNNYYSLPNKLFSYIRAGVPVVASDFPELRRIVMGCGVGEVCDPEDAKALAAAISSVVSDPARHERFREAARGAAEAFTWEREAEKLVEVYRRLSGVR